MRSLAIACLSALLFGATTTSAHNLGWAVGHAGAIFHSDTSGAIWRAQQSGATADLHGVDFSLWLTGIAVGDAGAVVYTPDGGATWFAHDLPYFFAQYPKDVAFVRENIGNLVGTGSIVVPATSSYNPPDAILHSHNGGESWDPRAIHTAVDLESVAFVAHSDHIQNADLCVSQCEISTPPPPAKSDRAASFATIPTSCSTSSTPAPVTNAARSRSSKAAVRAGRCSFSGGNSLSAEIPCTMTPRRSASRGSSDQRTRASTPAVA